MLNLYACSQQVTVGTRYRFLKIFVANILYVFIVIIEFGLDIFKNWYEFCTKGTENRA